MLKVIAKIIVGSIKKHCQLYSYIVYIKDKTISNKNLFLGYDRICYLNERSTNESKPKICQI